MTNPEIFVLSGPNGAGKSTTATVLLPETLSIEQFVNADLIARGLSPFAPMSSILEAGRIRVLGSLTGRPHRVGRQHAQPAKGHGPASC